MLGKRIAWIFFFSIVAAISSIVMFVQSAKFASLAKEQIRKHVTPTISAEVEFNRLKLSFFPPGLALSDVEIVPMGHSNPLGIPEGHTLKAERLGITFRMLQAFSAGITISKVFLTGADIFLRLPDANRNKTKSIKEKSFLSMISQPITLPISDNFYVKILQFEIRDSHLDLEASNGSKPFSLQIKQIEQISVRPEYGTIGILINISGVHTQVEGESIYVDGLRTNIDLMPNILYVQTFDVQRGEMVANLQGKLYGDLETPLELKADLRVLLRARAEAIQEFTAVTSGLGGVIEADLGIQGQIKDYKITATLKGQNLSYLSWQFDQLDGKAIFSPKALDLERLQLTRENGSMGIGSINIPYTFDQIERDVPIVLKKADFHQFAGELKHSVNNLEAIIDGAATVSVGLAKNNKGSLIVKKLKSQIDLEIADLNLNNQVFNKVRDKKYILKVKKAQLKGGIKLEGENILFDNTQITVPSGKLDVTGGVSTKGVFDIHGSSSDIDWGADVGAVAEIPLKGHGTIGINVHGPGDNIFLDFDAKIKDCQFINMNFGDFSGIISLDDKKSILTIKDLNAQKNQSNYTVAGSIFLDDTDKVDLRARFNEAAPDDIFDIFAHQLSALTWIPHGMTGLLRGSATLGGDFGKGGQNLVVGANLQGERLSYLGETVNEIRADVGFDRGNYYANNIQARKYNSQIDGNLTYSRDGFLKYDLNIKQGKIRDLDYFSTRGFPLDALWSLQSKGEGKISELKSHTSMDLTGAYLQAKALPDFHFGIDTSGGRTKIGAAMGNDLIVVGLDLASAADKQLSTLMISVAPSDLSFLLCAFNRALCNDPAASFGLSAKIDTSWPGRQWTKMSGKGEIKNISLQKNGFGITTDKPGAMAFDDGQFKTDPLDFAGPASKLRLSSEGKVDGKNLKISLKGETSLKIIEFLSPLIEEAQGRFKVDAGIEGPVEDASFWGGMQIRMGLLRISGVDATIENLNGDISLSENDVSINDMHAVFGGGQLNVNGGLELFLHRPPVFNIEMTGKDNRLKFFPVSYAEVEDVQLSFTGDHPPYLFGGLAKIREAVMRRNFDFAGGQKALQNARYLPEQVGGGSSFYNIKIKGVAESGIKVENDLMDAEFKGDVTLLNNFEYPQVIGKAELIKGKLLFRNSSFVLDHAVVRLPTPEIFRPQFSVGGVTNVNNYRISLFASGTPDDPKISFSSSPPLSQGDILSLLAFGFKGEDTKSVKQDDLSAITYSEVGSILLEQLRISKDLQSRGFKVNVVPTVNDNEANIVRPRSAADTASPKIVVQTQVAKNLEASLGATLGATQSQQVNGGLEYYLGKRASVSGIFEQNQAVDVSEPQTSYGADLKFRWGFQ